MAQQAFAFVSKQTRIGAVIALAGALGLASVTGADAVTLTVPATANIFRAGHGGAAPSAFSCNDHPESIGTAPPSASVGTAKAGRYVTFSSVTGLTHWGDAPVEFGPEGTGGGQDLDSLDGISAISDGTKFYLTGVFALSPTSAATPAKLNFSGGHGFASLAPAINQSFYIGDGLTGTGTGAQQKFYVPDSATTLYLGFMDGFDFVGTPGCYFDNQGSLSATFAVTQPQPPPPPDPSAVASIVELKTTDGSAKTHAFFVRGGKRMPLENGTELRPGDVIKVGQNTVAAFEFALGGRVGVRPGTEMRILSERTAGNLEIKQRANLEQGGIWAKCDKLKEPMEIQTNGGVTGIKG